MTSLKFIFLVLAIGIIGWGVRSFFTFPLHEETQEQSPSHVTPLWAFVVFIGGLGICSLILFIFALTGYFTAKVFYIFFFLFLGFHILKNRRTAFPLAFFRYLGVIFIFTLLILGLKNTVKPFEAIIHSSDAAVYVSASYHLANTGNLIYQDKLILEMTEEEREILFRNRFKEDNTAPIIRFPGGVPLISLSRGLVTFGFYPLFPIWLGLGNLFLGDSGFLYILSLFGFLSLTSLYFIGKELGNSLLGLSLLFVFLFFYPQVFFSSMPMSEVAAQAFFLTGALIFLGPHRGPILPEGKQLLTGLLWGSTFLCKMENMAFILISLTLAYSLVPVLRNNIHKWRHLLLCLFGFFLLALYFQLTHRVYVMQLSHMFSKANIFHLLTSLPVDHPVVFNTVFLFLSAVLALLFYFYLLNKPSPYRTRVGSILGLMLSGFLLIWFSTKFELQPFMFTLRLFTLYTSPWMFPALLLGVLFFLYESIHSKIFSRVWILLIIFAVSTFVRLVYSWIEQIHPWAVRRFVPIIFPLFFIFSFSGWYWWQQKIQGKYKNLLRVVISILVFIITASFFLDSRYLFHQTPFLNVVSQIRSMANDIPKNALVIIPDSEAGLQRQLPLRYMANRDVILLPHKIYPDEKFLKTMVSYLNRQLNKNRPILLLINQATTSPVLLTQNFHLNYRSDTATTFSTVLPYYFNEFPDHSTDIVLHDYLFYLEPKKQLSVNKSLNIGNLRDDINLNLEGFYAPEKTASVPEQSFRWAKNQAELLLPDISTFNLHVNAPRPSGAGRAHLKIDVNGVTLKTITLSSEPSTIQINIPEIIRKKRSPIVLHLTCNTFSPKKLGISSDNRELGFQLYQIDMGGNKETVYTDDKTKHIRVNP